jgi:hypothetical protein
LDRSKLRFTVQAALLPAMDLRSRVFRTSQVKQIWQSRTVSLFHQVFFSSILKYMQTKY